MFLHYCGNPYENVNVKCVTLLHSCNMSKLEVANSCLTQFYVMFDPCFSRYWVLLITVFSAICCVKISGLQYIFWSKGVGVSEWCIASICSISSSLIHISESSLIRYCPHRLLTSIFTLYKHPLCIASNSNFPQLVSPCPSNPMQHLNIL